MVFTFWHVTQPPLPVTHPNIPAAHLSRRKKYIKKLKRWKKKYQNATTPFNLLGLYVFDPSAVLETKGKRNKYSVSPWPLFPFLLPEDHELIQQETLLPLAQDTCLVRLDLQEDLHRLETHHHQIKLRWRSANGKHVNPVTTWKTNLS